MVHALREVRPGRYLSSSGEAQSAKRAIQSRRAMKPCAAHGNEVSRNESNKSKAWIATRRSVQEPGSLVDHCDMPRHRYDPRLPDTHPTYRAWPIQTDVNFLLSGSSTSRRPSPISNQSPCRDRRSASTAARTNGKPHKFSSETVTASRSKALILD